MRRIFGAGLLSLAFMASGINSGLAAGAVAIGQPSDVAKDGVSIGYNSNYKTMDEAKAGALEHCKSGGSAQSEALCQIVATYTNQCAAEALDPQAGTPGFGWAIADTSQEAKDQAMAHCRATAGPSRQNACVFVDNAPVRCDGSAK